MKPSLLENSNVLFTGVTGLIGGEIFRRLANAHEGRLWTLIRPTAERTIGERLVQRLQRSGESGSCAENVSPISGDIQKPDTDLSEDDREDILSDVDVIFHNAADTSFASHRDTAKTNIASVTHLIDLAKRCRRNPLIIYMSTAANAGSVNGRVTVPTTVPPPGRHAQAPKKHEL